MSENKKQKLTLSRETLRALNVKTSMKAGRTTNPSFFSCHCPATSLCDSIDACSPTKGPACPFE